MIRKPVFQIREGPQDKNTVCIAHTCHLWLEYNEPSESLWDRWGGGGGGGGYSRHRFSSLQRLLTKIIKCSFPHLKINITSTSREFSNKIGIFRPWKRQQKRYNYSIKLFLCGFSALCQFLRRIVRQFFCVSRIISYIMSRIFSQTLCRVY